MNPGSLFNPFSPKHSFRIHLLIALIAAGLILGAAAKQKSILVPANQAVAELANMNDTAIVLAMGLEDSSDLIAYNYESKTIMAGPVEVTMKFGDNVKFIFPAGCLSENTAITITKAIIANPESGERQLIIEASPHGTIFQVPLKLSFPIDLIVDQPDPQGKAADHGLFYYVPIDPVGVWTYASSIQLDEGNKNLFKTAISHFSSYAVGRTFYYPYVYNSPY
jgi:hypothetical protein